MRLMLTIIATACATSASYAEPLANRAVPEDVFYHFMPIAWRDSDNDAQRFGDFNGMTASLDYLEDLGITAVWMNPIFPSPAYHGYQHGPGDQVNSRLGTEAEFLAFVQAAHARGIKVFIDFVVYGISQDTIWHQSAYNNSASPYDNWLAFTNTANTNYLGSTYNTWNGAGVGFIHWNLDNPGPTNLVTTWARHWLDPDNDGDPSDGIDGFRLDHVWSQYPTGPNGWGYNLDWWVTWRDNLRAINPDVFIFAEQADWGTTGSNLLPAFDATMTKPWEFAVRDALSSETNGSLYSQTQATLASLPAGKQFMGIIGDHDVDRLSSVIGSSLEKGKAAAAILLTSPFPPMIYNGDEIGMRGVKGNYGSDANDIPFREPFKWNAVAGPPMSNYWILNSQAFNNAYSSNNDGRSVEEQDGVSGSLLEAYKRLIFARKNHVALRRGEYMPVPSSSSRIWAFVRHQPDEETLLVAINVNGQSRTSSLDLSTAEIAGGTTTVTDVISGASLTSLTNANKGAYAISLGAYAYRILSVNLQPPGPDPDAVSGFEIHDRFGPADLVATQSTATNLGDNISELDQLFVKYEPDGLRIAVTGNLATDGTALAMFFDTVSGGQNVLDTTGFNPPPGGPDQMTGTQFDAGFAPDHMLFINTFGGNVYVDQFVFPTAGAATKTYRGVGAVNAGNGFLSGGVNPNGMQVGMNNSNSLGVTDTSAAGAATADSGFELKVPFTDVGIAGTGDDFRILVFLMQSNGNVSNQSLPGLGSGATSLGIAPNLSTIAGNQFASVSPHLAGDIDGDGDLDTVDRDLLVCVLMGTNTDVLYVSRSDMNGDGMSDGRDIEAFLEALLSP